MSLFKRDQEAEELRELLPHWRRAEPLAVWEGPGSCRPRVGYTRAVREGLHQLQVLGQRRLPWECGQGREVVVWDIAGEWPNMEDMMAATFLEMEERGVMVVMILQEADWDRGEAEDNLLSI